MIINNHLFSLLILVIQIQSVPYFQYSGVKKINKWIRGH